jgi:putative colanic acid biosysnthesis UDP-glucose lipid carrier transferase
MSDNDKTLSVTTLLVKLADAGVILLSAYLALYIRRFLNFPDEMAVKFYTSYDGLAAIGALLYTIFSGNSSGVLFKTQALVMVRDVVGRWLLVTALLLLMLFSFKVSQEFSRVWFLIWSISVIILLCTGRIFIYFLLKTIWGMGGVQKRVALIGSKSSIASLSARLSSAGWGGYTILHSVENIDDLALIEALCHDTLNEVWIVLSFEERQSLGRILYALRYSAASIRLVPDLPALSMINNGLATVFGVPMYNVSTSPMTGINEQLKWLEDKVLSLLILLLVSPVMLMLAVGVKLNSPGPVFYKQERIGLNNRRFKILKFRSMPVDVEKDSVVWGGGEVKANTMFSQFIRRTSLDELPQFFNVLAGEMSIVGPRPERSIFVEQFKNEIPGYMKKHLVKAGITGWAQVNGFRGDTSLKMRIEYDLFYIENWSIWFDLKIILLTVFKIFLNKRAH